MSKLDELKIKLIVWNRTKSVPKSYEICDWLYKELIGRNGKTADATPTEATIEDKK